MRLSPDVYTGAAGCIITAPLHHMQQQQVERSWPNTSNCSNTSLALPALKLNNMARYYQWTLDNTGINTQSNGWFGWIL